MTACTAAAALVAACSSSPEQASSPEPADSVVAVPGAPTVDMPTVEIPSPARLAIPTIGLDEPLIELGLTSDGEMEVPSDYDDVGWFGGGGRPGGIGPTVLAGHVDSTTGPAVFHRLRDLSAGDTVTVTSSAGDVAQYRVDRVGDFSKDDFPTVDVFGARVDDRIRLVTCSGEFDSAVGSYEQNFVVFGVRI